MNKFVVSIPSSVILKNHTTAEWQNEAILKHGEPGYDHVEHMLKIGDGTSSWSELPLLKTQVAVATENRLGGVKSSLSANYVKVEETGFMKLNRVGVDLLYVPDSEEFILNCGRAIVK